MLLMSLGDRLAAGKFGLVTAPGKKTYAGR